ncbi:hypothetical protein [Cupriavidus sp. CuC1]|uniref:hypothetical protein n=1 Tax=Cupriavidus sp. CuC1 TaxID=3373131 RepID=UPI0037D2D58F
MITEADFLPLPDAFLELRDQLRIVRYELVHYSQGHAQREAGKYRHPPSDYEYAIHKIEYIDPESSQIFIDGHAFYSSEQRVPDWVKYHVKEKSPQGARLLKQWFTSPASLLLTALVPPYGLSLLGLSAVSDHMDRRDQSKLKQALPVLSELPKFWRPKL